jgi:hypothetical protein
MIVRSQSNICLHLSRQARDFCTVIHVRKLRDGTVVVLNRETSHPSAPQSSKYVRGKIVIGKRLLSTSVHINTHGMYSLTHSSALFYLIYIV